MPDYNPKIDIGYLARIANGNYAGARILWNLGLFLSSLHLLHESIEKYLKVLWSQDKTFKDKADLNKRMKAFGHDYNKVLKALNKKDRDLLESVAKKDGLKLYDLIGLRYGQLSLVMYNDILFRGAENIIRAIRQMIGQPQKKNLYEDLLTAIPHQNFGNSNKKKDILKQILSLPRTGPTKKQRKEHIKKFKALVAKLRTKQEPTA